MSVIEGIPEVASNKSITTDDSVFDDVTHLKHAMPIGSASDLQSDDCQPLKRAAIVCLNKSVLFLNHVDLLCTQRETTVRTIGLIATCSNYLLTLQ